MTHILDIHSLKKIYYKKIKDEYNLKFLDILKDYVDVDIIYNVINVIGEQTIKNIINYIFLKWAKINKNISYNNIKQIDINQFNNKLIEFINDELYKGVYVYNCIIVYLTQ